MTTYDDGPPNRFYDEGPIMAGQTISDELIELHDCYVWEVNVAVDQGDDKRVERLANEYTERALRIITSGRVSS
jgi:hypothetical protein